MKTLTLLIMMSISGLAEPDNSTNYSGDSFTISIGKDIKCKVSVPVDFSVYKFSQGGKPLFFVYEGNFPSFPKQDKGPPVLSTETINNVPVRVATWHRPDTDQISKEYLFGDPSKASNRPLLDVWYNALPLAKSKDVESFIHSIRYK